MLKLKNIKTRPTGEEHFKDKVIVGVDGAVMYRYGYLYPTMPDSVIRNYGTQERAVGWLCVEDLAQLGVELHEIDLLTWSTEQLKAYVQSKGRPLAMGEELFKCRKDDAWVRNCWLMEAVLLLQYEQNSRILFPPPAPKFKSIHSYSSNPNGKSGNPSILFLGKDGTIHEGISLDASGHPYTTPTENMIGWMDLRDVAGLVVEDPDFSNLINSQIDELMGLNEVCLISEKCYKPKAPSETYKYKTKHGICDTSYKDKRACKEASLQALYKEESLSWQAEKHPKSSPVRDKIIDVMKGHKGGCLQAITSQFLVSQSSNFKDTRSARTALLWELEKMAKEGVISITAHPTSYGIIKSYKLSDDA